MTEELAGARARLEDAKRQRGEAGALIEALEDRVRDGDEEVAALELGEQHGLLRLAVLQQERAEQQVKAAEAAELVQRRQAAVQAATDELDALSPDVLAVACDEALQAIDRVQQLGDARQAAVERHAQAFLDLGMRDRIRHQDGSWVVFEVDGDRYDTRQDSLGGRALLAAIEGERLRRAQIPGRLAKGFPPPVASSHPMAQLLAANAGVVAENGEAV